MIRTIKLILLATCIVVSIQANSSSSTTAAVAPANRDLTRLSEGLLNLRSEIESLSLTSQQENRSRQAEIDVLLQRKSELQTQILKEEMRKAQLREKLSSEDRQALKLTGKVTISTAKDKQNFLKSLAVVQTWIDKSLPFRLQERRATVISLLEKANESPHFEALAHDLWGILEKELKLTQENSVEILEMDFSSGRSKAQVARLGMFQMYYTKANGTVGRAILNGKAWVLEDLQSEDDKVKVGRLIKNLRANKGQGYFELPGFQVGVK